MIKGKFGKGEDTNPMVAWFLFGGIFMDRKLALYFRPNIVLLSSILQYFSVLCIAYKWKSPIHTIFLKQLVKP